MARDWRKTTVGAQVTLQRGFDITRVEQSDGAIPVVSSSGISSYHDVPAAEGPGVILGRKGVVGSVYYVPSNYWPHDTTLWVKDFHGNVPRFVYYFFRWKTSWLAALDVGSANPTLNRNHVHPLEISWPTDTGEQHEIAEVLGFLDDKIEFNRRLNETLESIAQAIFKSWFIDFDPVRAKVAGRRPVGMDADTAALFPDEFEGSRSLRVPKGWKVVSFFDGMSVGRGRGLAKGEVAPYLDMQNMPTKGHRPIGWKDRAFGSGTCFMNGDTLLARITPCLENGKTAFVDFLKESQVGWGSTEYIVLRPKPPLPPEYAYFLARSEDFRSHCITNMSGSSGRQRVPVECFCQLSITIPSIEVAEKFGVVARSVMGMILTIDEESRSLASIRDSLLPKLLSGKMRIGGDRRSIE